MTAVALLAYAIGLSAPRTGISSLPELREPERLGWFEIGVRGIEPSADGLLERGGVRNWSRGELRCETGVCCGWGLSALTIFSENEV